MVELIEFGGKRGFVDRGGDHRHRLRLQLHRLADPVGGGLHFLDGALDRAVGFDRLLGRLLDRGDLGGDVVGRARGLRSEALHLLRDDREAAAGIAGAGRLDGRVERKQIGLAGDVADQAEDRFDRLDVARQQLADVHCFARLAAGADRDVGRDLDFGTGVLDRADQARGGLRGFAHGDRRLLGGGGDFAGLAEHSARRSGGCPGALGQDPRLLGAAADQAGDPALELLALAAARVGGGVGFQKRHLGDDDVLVEGQRLAEGLDRIGLLVGALGEALVEGGEHVPRHAGASGDEGRHVGLGDVHANAFLGDRADPGLIDRAGELLAVVPRRILAEMLARRILDDVARLLPQPAHRILEPAAVGKGGEPPRNLVVGQALQMAGVAGHVINPHCRIRNSGFEPSARMQQPLAHQWLKAG